MNLVFSRSERKIRVYASMAPDDVVKEIVAYSDVRNELNHLRPRKGSKDVVYAILRTGKIGGPTMPRPFPLGKWNITGIVPHPNKETDGYLYPYFIATDAWDTLDEWELDTNGNYARPNGKKIVVGALGLHFSSSRTTLGCIRIDKEDDLRWLVEKVCDGHHTLEVTP